MQTILLLIAAAAAIAAGLAYALAFPKGLTFIQQMSVLWIPFFISGACLYRASSAVDFVTNDILFACACAATIAWFSWHMFQLRNDLRRARAEAQSGKTDR